MTRATAHERGLGWAPWWAIVLALLALIPPGAIVVTGLQQIAYGASGGHMSELAALIGPLLLVTGLMLVAPGVLYLILRRRFLFVVALVVAAAILLLTLT